MQELLNTIAYKCGDQIDPKQTAADSQQLR